MVPNPKHLLCTTFELRPRHLGVSSWSYLELELNQTATPIGSDMFTSFILITHERGELPFSAYDRHIQTSLIPGSEVSVYFSKSVTARLNTKRNPCHVGPAMSLRTLWEDRASNDETSAQNRAPFFDTGNSTTHDGEDDDEQWHLDFLDRLRINRTGRSPTQTDQPKLKAIKGSTVKLFGTEFLYSREACGWAECSRKVRQVCNCSSVVELWSYKMQGCEQVEGCERSECQVKQISYKTCPLACVVAKFVKHNTITESGPETNLEPGKIRVKLVRSEAVQVATEEEIFSLAKLFSEVGGLCSLFIGFSCIFLFELVEAIILMYKNSTTSELREETAFCLPSSTDKGEHRVAHNNIAKNIVAEYPTVLTNETADKIDDSSMVPSQTEQLYSMSNGQHGSINTQTAEVDKRQLVKNPSPSCKNVEDQSDYCSSALPGWEGDILVIPVCFANGNLLTLAHNLQPKNHNLQKQQDTNLGFNLTNSIDITKEELLSLLRQNRVKLRMY